MRKLLAFAPTALVIAACSSPEPPPPPPPDTVVVTDTITITREVAPPLPEGQVAQICLATGQNIQIRVSMAGDTLVGPRRVRLMDLGPAVGFLGDYAADEAWFLQDENVRFNNRNFTKFGQEAVRDCQELKIVGDFQGVNIFSETTAAEPFEILYVPVRPGVFQPYQVRVGRVRG